MCNRALRQLMWSVGVLQSHVRSWQVLGDCHPPGQTRCGRLEFSYTEAWKCRGLPFRLAKFPEIGLRIGSREDDWDTFQIEGDDVSCGPKAMTSRLECRKSCRVCGKRPRARVLQTPHIPFSSRDRTTPILHTPHVPTYPLSHIA